MGAHAVIGTAGHIDHGKSTLVQSLTGTDPDRLEEERRRGITIELGFARLNLGDGRHAAVVDVPGHERFVRTMVAGAGGVDVVLLVVAADEGVMPQTLEHLDVCRLLGIQRGVVALTKIDLLDDFEPGWIDLVRADVESAIAGTFLEGCAIVPVSAQTGEGTEMLVEALAESTNCVPQRSADGPLFLPVDRAFTMKGFGTVVTGTMLSGCVEEGASVDIVPELARAEAVRVRSVQVHGSEVPRASAGQRAAVNLAGLEKAELSRGMVVVEPGASVVGAVLDVRIEALPSLDRPIKQRARLLVHLGTATTEATVILLEGSTLAPGASAFAQLHLDRPLAALPGQSFILRGSRVHSRRGRTVAGGRVLALAVRRRRPSHEDALSGLTALASEDEAVRIEGIVEVSGGAGVAEDALAYRTGLPRGRIQKTVAGLLSRGVFVRADTERRIVVHRSVVDALVRAALEMVRRHHAKNTVSLGLSRESLRSSLEGPPSRRLFGKLLERLDQEGAVTLESDLVRLVQAPRNLDGDDARDTERLAQRLRQAGLTPPRPKELAVALSLGLDRIQALLGRMVEEGTMVRVKRDLYFAAEPIASLRARLETHLDARGEIDTQQFKEMTGATRKHSIPLGEYFDEQHLTLRVGDKRVRRTRTVR